MADEAIEIEVQIKNNDGLHMRPAMQFVDIANRYMSKITVSNEDTTVDGKSIMQMTMLAATQGTRLKIKACGEDARDAVLSLQDLIENKLFEQSGTV